MTTIEKATIKDAELLSIIGRQTFIESHGKSAARKDILNYVESKFTKVIFGTELKDKNNVFHLLNYNQKPIGYSKIIYNVPQDNIQFKNVTKLERLYILEEFHHLKLGLELFNFNIELSKNHNQAGMWLFTWIENYKAINFYKKAGFTIIGSYDFKISDTHSNPNHQMLLVY
ncbi:GNAT family N-acetyltransferase [Xanthomarina sp. F2636L]|uniref:GNAT family N-acetyltransferase n=1 Tax=Xanthomarina sp. F2636L TaxID=2996018 RepID=UPI00225E077F|nr:GNAT family N-acetyltransferase [Xanthomarina sp. F2636L]MCX7549444.1 GNAT family N-acetyltransferase [Xanthomarina sp. F2636L]